MKFMLDAGHALGTPGKRSPDGMREFEFNSVVANYCKAQLEQYKDVVVYMAHDPSGKVDIPLTTRANRANQLKVDVYVSIHANAFGAGGWNSAAGIETFTYTSKPKEAVALAQKVQANLVKETGLPDRGVKSADFAVLRETDMTSILTECGFMTNKEEVKLLRSDAYRRKCANAIVKGLVEQYKLVPEKPVVEKASFQSKAPAGLSRRVNVVTGALGRNWMIQMLDYVQSQKWSYRIEGPQKGNPHFVVGFFWTGGAELHKLEKWLQDKKWSYKIEDHK